MTEEHIDGWTLDAYGGQFRPDGFQQGKRNSHISLEDDGTIEVEPADYQQYIRIPLTVMKRFIEMADEWRSRKRQGGRR